MSRIRVFIYSVATMLLICSLLGVQVFGAVEESRKNRKSVNLQAIGSPIKRELPAGQYVFRAQIARFIRRNFSISLKLDCEPFKDVSKDFPLFADIQTLKCNGFFKGYSDNTFRPLSYLNKGDAITLVMNSAKKIRPGIYPNIFGRNKILRDLPKESAYFDPIMRAYSHQIISINLDKSVKPEEEISREELISLVGKVAKFKNNPIRKIIRQKKGVSLYEMNGALVQTVNLRQGAKMKFKTETVRNPGKNKGFYGNDNPTLNRAKFRDIWNYLKKKEPKLFSLSNGGFFRDDARKETELAFPLKRDKKWLADGYAGKTEFYGQKRVMELWPNRAKVSVFDENNPYKKLYSENFIVGLSRDANKGINSLVPRTFVGVGDDDFDGDFETIYLVNSPSATQLNVSKIMESFGIYNFMMLDGGGSTQLFSLVDAHITSSRTIPQTLIITHG